MEPPPSAAVSAGSEDSDSESDGSTDEPKEDLDVCLRWQLGWSPTRLRKEVGDELFERLSDAFGAVVDECKAYKERMEREGA